MNSRLLVLVDGSSYLFRAFHALPPLVSRKGEPTGAVLGVLNMLYRLVDEFQPDHVAVVFDAPGKTFRNDLYAKYKANRPPVPDDLRAQFKPLTEAVEAIGFPVLSVRGVEADDVIGTLAQQATQSGLSTLISTSDKDMAQLVNDHVTLINTMSGVKMDPDGVKQKFGVFPNQIVDYLALVGDASDNIPGVPGVGPKTASKWLTEYAALENLQSHAAEIKGKVGEKLRASLEHLPLYRELTTIRCDVDLSTTVSELKFREPNKLKLRSLYERLELKTLLRKIDDGESEPQSTRQESVATESNYETVLTEKQLNKWVERIQSAELVALDTETTSLNYMEAQLVGISLSVEPGEAAYIPIHHTYAGAPEQLDQELVLEKLGPWLESNAPKVGHHLKYDTHILRNHGIKLKGIVYDSMLESYVLNSTATRHDMDSVAKQYLNTETTKYEEIAGRGAKQLRFDEIAIEIAAPYAAEDADITLRLHRALWPKLEATPALAELYQGIEQPLVEVLQEMEYVGVMVDAKQLNEQSQEIALSLKQIEKEAHSEAGGAFNLDSPKQLQEILYDNLKLPILGKTPKGQPSTAEAVLQALAEDYELPNLVLKYRSLSKLKSTYTDKLPAQINRTTGRIHTSYHQAITATGRLSSSKPNLQNIPIRTPQGRRIRQAFIAPPGKKLIAADYSQIELRIMAHLSGDKGLRGAFAEDQDIHKATAAEIFSIKQAKVQDTQRRSAKAINFGLIYGMSAFGLARQLNIKREDAQAYVDLYFERYPSVKQYMDDTRRQAREQGYVSTVFGRRLYLPEIESRNHQRRQYAERSAINAPMQGTAADIIKRAMVRVEHWLEENMNDAALIMQVHDELVLEVPEDQAFEVSTELAQIMESAAELSVPLKVETGIGFNWDEAH